MYMFVFVEKGRRRREINDDNNRRVGEAAMARSPIDGWRYASVYRSLFLCFDSISDGD